MQRHERACQQRKTKDRISVGELSPDTSVGHGFERLLGLLCGFCDESQRGRPGGEFW